MQIGESVTFCPGFPGAARLIGRIIDTVVLVDRGGVWWVESEDGHGYYAGIGPEWGDIELAEPDYVI